MVIPFRDNHNNLPTICAAWTNSCYRNCLPTYLHSSPETDERVRLMSEIINGIQVIKMYAWEKSFVKLVELARSSEIHHIRNASYLKALQMSFNMFINRTAIFLCVLGHVLSGYSPTAEYVFVITSFYGILKQAVTTWFPLGVTAIAEANVSIERIQTFLKYDESYFTDEFRIKKKKSKSKKKKSEGKTKKKWISSTEDSKRDTGIYLEKACAKWAYNSPENTLSDITLSITSNQLVAIIGPVGSGKTSLVHMILKELPIVSGKLEIVGNISYASQEPWLFSGSIQQNILFGDTYDPIKYQEVIKVCALERDLSLFPYGDKSIVGDRGVTLSGGQRARINLARAIYKDADIYIFDDPLSAVDTHVGKQLFENCICGYLKYKATILVTHQIQYLANVDRIYLMENGRVEAEGTYQDILNSGKEFAELFKAEIPIEDDDEEEEKFIKKRKKKFSVMEEQDDIQDEPLVESEGVKKGSISGRVYRTYLKAGSNYFMGSILIVFFILAQLSASGADYFITYWVNLEQARKEQETMNIYLDESLYNATLSAPRGIFNIEFTRQTCVIIYSSLIASIIFVTITRSLTFFKLCMKASKNLHNNMFSKIVNATMHFFNANSAGRILNRFSKDMGAIDELLPAAIIDTIQVGIGVLATSILIATVNPWILVPTFVILAWFYLFRYIYLASSRNIKRMEGTTRSPVFAHLSATLQGLTTIRAFGAQEILTIEFDNHQNLHSSAYYLFLGCSRSFGFWLDLKCVLYVGFVTVSVLFIGSETYGGNVGLAITQAIGLTGMFQWGMRQWSELENQMTSVERVVEYTEVEKEPILNKSESPETWPKNGEIEFRNVFLKYSPSAPYVLKNLNFTVHPMEKIGIVGRTGAGKSSLISALFLLTDIEGQILIDGIDTKKITLESMRSKISIIPQEPVLFSGTLRKNLDPFDDYDDEKLWDALDNVELKKVVADFPLGLNTLISEGGSNFSVGQRQLVCLARAIVRNNRILVLDEATANVDPKTDALIQTAIRKNFAKCTVLTIAHRLHTIMDSDKVLVMNAGTVSEFGHPHELLQNTRGIFYSLVKETGKVMADNLHNIAQDNFEARH
ncbi:probable multidrug resistance-associated protein lethal(2)03659 isoform X2 [Coccinella septempunctata]|uniref:probable multidrug resistance-associated protein lethal(2)03659 isoform X2 n=1 Tax=Coccinella septempunctata TaxID=41139 RepID=UPI001D05D873|nr:probable multidrug resistance-associated protein lethal(2)03659 isoform X2 [Coccinella septempunctata]